LEAGVSSEIAPLRRLLGKTVAWSTLDVVVGRLGQFTQGVIIARIVAPRYFGVFAIALTVHMIVVNVSELGVGAALIRDDPSRTRRSAPTVATITLVTSGLLAALIFALSPILASSLGSARAAGPIKVMALNLPLAGLTAVPSALLKRDFRMDRMFVADTANMLVTFAVVVPLAVAGWGALALAWSWVAGQVATTVLLLSYRPARFWPGWNKAEARRLLAFGLPLAGMQLLGMAVLNVDYITVGRLLGAVALGFYMLAFNISGWPINVLGYVINSVSLPGFSRLRNDGAAMPAVFPRSLRLVATITLPVCFIIGALAHPAVGAIYGERWAPAASALVGLSVLAAGRILETLVGDFLIALGRTRAVLLAELPWLIALTGTLILVAPRYGIAGVGVAQACVVVGVMGPVCAVLLHQSGVSLREVARVLIRPLLWALLAAAVAHAVSSLISNDFAACVAGGIAGLAVASVPFARVITRKISATVRRTFARGRSSGTSVVEPVGPT
jgi:O-antigen/teichoic acid export membrane protein